MVKNFKLSVLQRNMYLSLLGVIVALSIGMICSPARAEDVDFSKEVEKVDKISSTIAGIVTSMTNVTVLPMGISASMKTFRHIVLANV